MAKNSSVDSVYSVKNVLLKQCIALHFHPEILNIFFALFIRWYLKNLSSAHKHSRGSSLGRFPIPSSLPGYSSHYLGGSPSPPEPVFKRGGAGIAVGVENHNFNSLSSELKCD